MQTGRKKSFGEYEFSQGDTEFELVKAYELALVVDLRSSNKFSVYFEEVHESSRRSIPMAVDVNFFSYDGKVSGVNNVRVTFSKSGQLVSIVRSKAVGVAPMDTTPMAVQTQLPAPTMEELIRRELRKHLPRKETVDEPQDIEDEVVQRAGGKDYSIDDEDPDDPLEVTPADLQRARAQRRQRPGARVQSVDSGSDTSEDSDRGRSADSGPQPSPGESEPSGS